MRLERRQGVVEALQALQALQVLPPGAGHLAQAELPRAELPQVPRREAEAVAGPAPLVRVARRCRRRVLHKKSDLRAA